MLKEKMLEYYGTGIGCAEATIRAANDVYSMGLNETAMKMFAGYAGGNGCGDTCGVLTGSMALLTYLYADKGGKEFNEIRKEFIKAFTEKMGATDCNTIKVDYFVAGQRCVNGVAAAGEVLEKFIAEHSEKAVDEGRELTEDEKKRVKALGFLHDKRTKDKFNGRVITVNGKITSEEATAIAEASKKYGSGEVTMTSRLTVEIQGVSYDNIQPLRDFLAQYGLETGGTGSKVRPVVSCKGTTCQYGLIDTFALSKEIHEIFYKGWHDVTLPHKFKIAVGGCPNNCVKPDLNDLGIIGQRVPAIDLEKCRGCKVCQVENACPIKCASVKDGKIEIADDCNHCGRCLNKCPFGAVNEEMTGYKVYIGGRWGKKVAHGQYLNKVFTSKEEVLSIVEKAILLFRSEGITGERFADTIARLGFDYVEDKLLNGEFDKAAILGLDVVGGAIC